MLLCCFDGVTINIPVQLLLCGENHKVISINTIGRNAFQFADKLRCAGTVEWIKHNVSVSSTNPFPL